MNSAKLLHKGVDWAEVPRGHRVLHEWREEHAHGVLDIRLISGSIGLPRGAGLDPVTEFPCSLGIVPIVQELIPVIAREVTKPR